MLILVVLIFVSYPSIFANASIVHSSSNQISSTGKIQSYSTSITKRNNEVIHPPPTKNEEDNYFPFSVHLVSLPPLNNTIPLSIRHLWQWKDVALGNGRDFFLPRPRAISALQSLLLQCDGITECAVLSNCARLDVFLLVHHHNLTYTSHNNHDINTSTTQIAKYAVATSLASQLTSHQQSNNNNLALQQFSSLLDLPGIVNPNPPPASQESIEEIQNHLVEICGVRNVVQHACLVASGMKDRPNRPGRKATFRPFSSRDAHIMLQMKRTKQLAEGSRIQMILDAALQAGKASRDPEQVPQLKLLHGYGGESRYSQEAPLELSKQAAQAAFQLAIQPSIQRCESKFIAMKSSRAISNLVKMTEMALLQHGQNRKNSKGSILVRKIIHKPIMDLREGKFVNQTHVLHQVNLAILELNGK